jgi:hypothetical protein
LRIIWMTTSKPSVSSAMGRWTLAPVDFSIVFDAALRETKQRKSLA